MAAEAKVPDGFWAKVTKLIDDRIAKALRAPIGSMAVSGASGITVKNGGVLRLSTADGVEAFLVGPVSPDLPDGSPQPGWIVRRADGTVALMLWDPRPDLDGYSQFLGWYDRQGHIVFSDDTVSGFGIARPHLAHAFYTSRVQDFPKSTAAAFETVFRARVEKQQPKLYVEAWGACDTAGTTGQVQVTVNGVVWGAPQNAVSGVVNPYQWGPVTVDGNFGDTLNVEIQARRTAGTGSVQVGAGFVQGTQS